MTPMLWHRDPTKELLNAAQQLLIDLRLAARDVRAAGMETKAAAADLRQVARERLNGGTSDAGPCDQRGDRPT